MLATKLVLSHLSLRYLGTYCCAEDEFCDIMVVLAADGGVMLGNVEESALQVDGRDNLTGGFFLASFFHPPKKIGGTWSCSTRTKRIILWLLSVNQFMTKPR